MHVDAGQLRLSPSDLSAFLGCRHRTGLDLAVARGVLEKPAWDDPLLQALRDRGAAHERAYVDSLRQAGLRVVEIETDAPAAARAAATLDVMRNGADVIVQAALRCGEWTGYADVLRRVDAASHLGSWSYEPFDTKLARQTRGGTILQLAVYADLLERLQGIAPEAFYVVTPRTPETNVTDRFDVQRYRFSDVAAYFRVVRGHLLDTIALGHDAIDDRYYPDAVEQCEICRWWLRCNAQRRHDDHLSFIAGTGRLHRQELIALGFPTLAAAAAIPLPIAFKPARGSRDAYVRIREQARLQLAQRTTGQPVHELLPARDGQGLARLPAPSSGDLFLDLEGARFARDGGREYLIGLWRHDRPDAVRYAGTWAVNDREERAAFESTIDEIMRAWSEDPGAHVYHFGHYEPSALKRLMGRYATRGDELDRLLRAERFVDLHAIVRQALRAGVESYSIKQLERFYGFARAVDLRDAATNLQAVESALEGNTPDAIGDAARGAVLGYNRDDCRSTAALRDWLERLRSDAIASGAAIARPVPKEGSPNEKVLALEQRQDAARAGLLANIAPDAIGPGHAQHPYWLLAYLLDWHRREDKSQYWERYRLSELADPDLFDERQAIAGLEFIKRLEETPLRKGGIKSVVDRYRYPLQEVEIGSSGELRVFGNKPIGTIEDHDRVARTIDIKKTREHALHPSSVFQAIVFPTDGQQESLLRFVETVDAESCGTDLLFRRPPRLRSGRFERQTGESAAAFAVRLAPDLDRTTLAVQGPPGAGKTHVGAQMIRGLVRAGKRVGVTAVSHKVIRHLLDAVREQERADATAAGQGRLPLDPIVLGHKCDPEEEIENDDSTHAAVREYDSNDSALAALGSGEIQVLGGTSWLWSRPDAAASVDILFVDEAGQMSLANALAVSPAAQSLVLLGDPQQLEQPQKGSHPDGVGVSALEHVLGGAATMPADRGVFLPTTWRLHPAICALTSELFYDGKLESKPGLERQRLSGTGAFDGAGLWWVAVTHDGNQNYSLEEVEAVAGLVERFLAPDSRWIDERGTAHAIAASDLRIVAPFNAQVNRLIERLSGRGVPIGTVDKFQGQQAPIVIYSMATSRAEDAPRGMEFLYSLNRFNVATSRARCAAIVVASPRLLEPECRTPRQMVLANALCRFVEMANLGEPGREPGR